MPSPSISCEPSSSASPRSVQDTEVNVIVVRRLGDLGRHLHVYWVSGAIAIGVDVLDMNVGSRIGVGGGGGPVRSDRIVRT